MKHINYILFIVLSFGFLLAWTHFVMPWLAPPRKPNAVAQQPEKPPKKAEAKTDTGKAPEKNSAKNGDKSPAKTAETKGSASKPAAVAETPHGSANDQDKKAPAAADKKQAESTSFPHRTVDLGSSNPESGYFLLATLDSQGGSVRSIEFNDKRYRELKDLNTPLRIVGDDRGTNLKTFNTTFPDVDAVLTGANPNVADRDWAVAEITHDPANKEIVTGVTFRYPVPAADLVLEKHYWLQPLKPPINRELRDTATEGYLLYLDVTLKNVGKKEVSSSYVLQGPVGLPLENAENTRKYRDLKMGFLSESGAVNAQSKTAAVIVSDEEKKKDQEWKTAIRYIGVDVQYFAALVIPVDNQLTDRTIARSMPMVLDHPQKSQFADISVQLESKVFKLAPQETSTQRYKLFAGPKRKALLEPLQAESVLDYGWFASVSHVMLMLLQFFHSMGLPYGIAIICLTVLVRACMFPVSLRQTAQAQRMKEMQIPLAEMKKKYANDKEKLAKANLELMKKYKVNPVGGCLPVLLQMPIFIGLYQALNNSVDLRLQPFLYFNNLAGPDALFRLPMALPFLGSDFNLLPLITVALFVVQQKMFMPPPTDEQQEMQYKMMNVMMVVMGVMFYQVPAGLCIYFISSSLWGMGERKILGWWKTNQPAAADGGTPEDDQSSEGGGDGGHSNGPRTPNAPEKQANGMRNAAGSFWNRLVSAADAAGVEASSGSKSGSSRRIPPPGKKNNKRSR